MRTKKYTIAQLTQKVKNKGVATCYGIYNENDHETFHIFDKDFRVLASDQCREILSEHVFELINQGKVPAYIGITLAEEVADLVKESHKVENHLDVEKRAKSGAIKLKNAKKAEKALIRKARSISSHLTSIEKAFNFSTHTLRCLSVSNDLNELDVEHIWNNGRGGFRVNSLVEQTWVFRFDKQWISSPPVLSYFLLCLRELGYKDFSKKTIYNRPMYRLLSKKKPHKLFGKSRKVNWGCTDVKEGFDYFDSLYGVDAFENQYTRRARLILRERFPNNSLFKK